MPRYYLFMQLDHTTGEGMANDIGSLLGVVVAAGSGEEVSLLEIIFAAGPGEEGLVGLLLACPWILELITSLIVLASADPRLIRRPSSEELISIDIDDPIVTLTQPLCVARYGSR